MPDRLIFWRCRVCRLPLPSAYICLLANTGQEWLQAVKFSKCHIKSVLPGCFCSPWPLYEGRRKPKMLNWLADDDDSESNTRALDSGLCWKSSNRGQQMLTYRGLPQKCTCAIKNVHCLVVRVAWPSWMTLENWTSCEYTHVTQS